MNTLISTQARQGIDYIFEKSIRKSLILGQGGSCDIKQLAGENDIYLQGNDIYVLTISSFSFKLLTIFHVSDDLETKNYFLNNSTGHSFEDVFSEICNLCSGSMNQELLRYFPHLGMSTPYLLSAQCFPYLKDIKPDYLSRHAITINDAIRLQATICLCAYAPVDFCADKSEVVDTSGELKFF